MASSSVALRHECRRLEGSCNSWVKSNGSIVVLLEPLVSILTALLDPLFELLANSGVDDVADVRPGHLSNFPQNRQRIHHLCEAQPVVENEVQL